MPDAQTAQPSSGGNAGVLDTTNMDTLISSASKLLSTQETQGFADIRARDQQIGKIAEGMASDVSSIRDKYPIPKAPDIEPAPEPFQRSPLQAFGNYATAFAVLGSLLTRQPLTTALNAAASSMNALRQGDVDEWQRQTQVWKANTDYAFKTFDAQQAQYRAVLDSTKLDIDTKSALLTTLFSANRDETAMMQLQAGRIDSLEKMLNDREALRQSAQRQTDTIQYLYIDNYYRAVDEAEKAKGAPLNSQERMAILNQTIGGATGLPGSKAMTAPAKHAYAAQLKFMADALAPDDPQRAALLQQSEMEEQEATAMDDAAAKSALAKKTPTAASEEGESIEKWKQEFRDAHGGNEPNAAELAGGIAQVKKQATPDKPLTLAQEQAATVEMWKKEFQDKNGRPPNAAEQAAGILSIKSASGQPSLTPDAIDLNAKLYLATGQMPALGFGGVADRIAIANRAAEIAQEQGFTAQDIISGHIQYKADQQSIDNLQKMADAGQSFEDTMLRNLGVVKSLMNKGAGTAAGPVINRWLQAGKQATGDPDVKAFNIAITTAMDEYAKILSGNTTGGQRISDSAREQTTGMLNGWDSPQAILNGIDAAIIPDAHNRVLGWSSQLTVIRNRAGTFAPPSASTDLQAGAIAGWGKYEPDKYNYRFNPDTGRVQRAPK